MNCEFHGTSGRLTHGKVAMIPSEAVHLYEGLTSDSELLVIDVNLADPVIQSIESSCDLNISETLFHTPEIIMIDHSTLPLIEFAAQQLKKSNTTISPIVNHQIISLFLSQLCSLSLAPNEKLFSHERLDTSRLNYLLDSRLEMPPSNSELASAMNLSNSQFYYVFQKQFGMTPQQYVLKRRLQKAYTLLEQTIMPVSEISLSIGFSDTANFSRTFKKYFRVSPREVRT